MPKFINIFYIFPIQLNGNITVLSQKITSFENTKSEIAASGLGAALGLAASNTWAQIVAKIKSVINRGTLNWSGNNTTFAVPAGYYPGGTLDSRPSYNNGYNAGVTAADNRAAPGTVNYQSGYNAGVAAGKNSVFIQKVNQSYFNDPNSWAMTGNSWGSGTSERLMTKEYAYPAGYTKFFAVITASSESSARIRYINMSSSTSKIMVTPKAEETDNRGGYAARGVGAFIEGTLNPNGGTLTLSVSISRYSNNDLVTGLITML